MENIEEKINEIREVHRIAERWNSENEMYKNCGYKTEFEVSMKCRFVGNGGDTVATWDRSCDYIGEWSDDETVWTPGKGCIKMTLGDFESYLFAPDRETREMKQKIIKLNRRIEDAIKERDELLEMLG